MVNEMVDCETDIMINLPPSSQFSQSLYNETNMMYPELITRPDLKVRDGGCG